MEIENSLKINSTEILADFINKIGFALLIIFLGIIIYFDDIQITVKASQDIPTIYNIRFGGIKLMDFISIGLTSILLIYFFLKDKIVITDFHRNVFTMFAVYCFAAIVGFIYSFWLRYDYLNVIQDFQQILYLTGFFLFIFYFVDTIKKWKILVFSFISFLAIKNFIIIYKILSGKGIVLFAGIIRASQNSEFAYFPILFFTVLTILFHKSNYFVKLILLITILVYLANTLIGMVRTVWVVLFFGMILLLFQTERKVFYKIILATFSFFILFNFSLYLINPLAFNFLWTDKVLSIFEWDFKGNLSNAVRMVQISNVWQYVISHLSFLHGMGLGAWWDDEFRSMLPNISSEYQQKSHFRKTDIWIVTQFLKIGLIGMFFYWKSVFTIFKNIKSMLMDLQKNIIEYKILLGLFIGLFCAFLTNADHVRLHLIIGVLIGLFASFQNITKDEKIF